jgi:hypothetical protein
MLGIATPVSWRERRVGMSSLAVSLLYLSTKEVQAYSLLQDPNTKVPSRIWLRLALSQGQPHVVQAQTYLFQRVYFNSHLSNHTKTSASAAYGHQLFFSRINKRTFGIDILSSDDLIDSQSILVRQRAVASECCPTDISN